MDDNNRLPAILNDNHRMTGIRDDNHGQTAYQRPPSVTKLSNQAITIGWRSAALIDRCASSGWRTFHRAKWRVDASTDDSGINAEMRGLNVKEAERLWTTTKIDLNVWVDANLT
jgi:hypothetical protein